MAQWKETLEPYIKVYERIKTATIVPTAGEDLIVGATIISDSGPTTPVLITSQKDFLNTYASRDLTKDYVNSLNDLYLGDDKTLASTMWLNAYRLAGSTNLLVVRASKGADLSYVKPMVKPEETSGTFIIRDGQLLKKVSPFKFVIDTVDDEANHPEQGWAISINEVGIIGNLTTDKGAEYDYYVRTLEDLVEALNDTSKFFSPKYEFHKTAQISPETLLTSGEEASCVYFEEVYIAANFLDLDGFSESRYIGDNFGSKSDGLAYMTAAEPEWLPTNSTQPTLDLTVLSNFEDVDFYATNVYNSNTELKVRIRRFNHDAVVTKDSEPTVTMYGASPYRVLTKVLDVLALDREETYRERDFYEVAVLDPSLDSDPLYFNIGNIPGRGDMTVEEVNESLKMINLNLPDDMKSLNLGYWRGNPEWEASNETFSSSDDISEYIVLHCVEREVAARLRNEIENEKTKALWVDKAQASTIYVTEETKTDELVVALQVTPPAGENDPYTYDNYTIVEVENPSSEQIEGALLGGGTTARVDELPVISAVNKAEFIEEHWGEIVEGAPIANVNRLVYFYTATDTPTDEYNSQILEGGVVYNKIGDINEQIVIDLSLPTSGDDKSYILTVSDGDLKRSISSITEDEIYTVEGLTDLGNTSLDFQSYLCNMAKNENYFYPISTVNSTNYLAIANFRSKLAQDSHKLYTSAPWDIDTGTVGFKFYASPSVIYWEAVAKNRSMDREFASVFGFNSTGQVLYTKPVTEFTKKQRQLLLSKQINTAMWNTQSQTWNMNDCYTLTSENHILNEDGNSRLFIRINKAIPTLLKPLIGRKINDVTYADAEDILKYWFKRTIQPMQYTVDDYRITISGLDENDDEARRQNKMYVLVECRFARSLKYIIVYSDAIDMGMEFTGEI